VWYANPYLYLEYITKSHTHDYLTYASLFTILSYCAESVTDCNSGNFGFKLVNGSEQIINSQA